VRAAVALGYEIRAVAAVEEGEVRVGRGTDRTRGPSPCEKTRGLGRRYRKRVRNGRGIGRVDHFPRGKGKSAITENHGRFQTRLREAIGDRWQQALALRVSCETGDSHPAAETFPELTTELFDRKIDMEMS
jgi:hypothetical protein